MFSFWRRKVELMAPHEECRGWKIISYGKLRNFTAQQTTMAESCLDMRPAGWGVGAKWIRGNVGWMSLKRVENATWNIHRAKLEICKIIAHDCRRSGGSLTQSQHYIFIADKCIIEVDYGHIVSNWWRRWGLENRITEYCQFHRRCAKGWREHSGIHRQHSLKAIPLRPASWLYFKVIKQHREGFSCVMNFILTSWWWR